jgi:predicted DNA-binding transcriptional regulator AlpA
MTGKLHLRTPEAADYLGLSASTMEKMRLRGNGPRYAKLGRLVVYAIADLEAWVDTRKRLSTLEKGPNLSGSEKLPKKSKLTKGA